MQKGFSFQFWIIVSFMMLYIVWGTTYLAIAIGLESFPPFFMAGLRFIIAAVALLGYSIISGEGLPNKKSIIKNTILGFVILTGGQGLLIWSEQYIASGFASILIATLPIWFVIIDRSNWSYYFNNKLILVGLVLGFGGILVLFNDQLTAELPAETIKMNVIASLAVIIGGVFWVSGTLYNRSKPAYATISQSLGWQLLSGALLCFVISGVLGEFPRLEPAEVATKSWMAVLYLSLVSNVGAFIAYTFLLKNLPSAIVGTYAYINPIVAVLLGWMIADEVITLQQIIGMAIILFSAVLINLNRK